MPSPMPTVLVAEESAPSRALSARLDGLEAVDAGRGGR